MKKDWSVGLMLIILILLVGTVNRHLGQFRNYRGDLTPVTMSAPAQQEATGTTVEQKASEGDVHRHQPFVFFIPVIE